jgi:hypothetical protein
VDMSMDAVLILRKIPETTEVGMEETEAVLIFLRSSPRSCTCLLGLKFLGRNHASCIKCLHFTLRDAPWLPKYPTDALRRTSSSDGHGFEIKPGDATRPITRSVSEVTPRSTRKWRVVV